MAGELRAGASAGSSPADRAASLTAGRGTTLPDPDELRRLAAQHGTPLLVLDRRVLRERLALFSECLPGVVPHYAVKAFPHPEVIRTLGAAGASFDIATSGEIDLLKACRMPCDRVIHTHPIKRDRDIRAALRYGCTTFVVDNAAEIEKFGRYRERVGLLLRIRIDNPTARINLSRKFGCAPAQAPELIAGAVDRGVHVKGLSFHVGSQTPDPAAHVAAIEALAGIFAECRGVTGARLRVLDIGGGFPVADRPGTDDPLPGYCAPIQKALETLVPRLTVVAEPGRALVAPALTSVNEVVGSAERGGVPWYYLDDGVYGAFSGRVFDHASYELMPLTCRGAIDAPPRRAVVAGPTCDGIDVVSEEAALPPLAIGDLIYAPMIGAYSWATATEFNSIPKPPVVCVPEDS